MRDCGLCWDRRRPCGTDDRSLSSVGMGRRPAKSHEKCGARFSLNPEVGSFVSGHGFSRAANRGHAEGFSPCLFTNVRAASAPGLLWQGLKPRRCIGSARLKPCPDTRLVLSWFLGCGNSASPKLSSEFGFSVPERPLGRGFSPRFRTEKLATERWSVRHDVRCFFDPVNAGAVLGPDRPPKTLGSPALHRGRSPESRAWSPLPLRRSSHPIFLLSILAIQVKIYGGSS